MLRPTEGARQAIAAAQALGRRPGPFQDWVPIDELLLAWRRELSSAECAVARALNDRTVWDESMVQQLTRGIEEKNSILRNQISSLRVSDLVEAAERLARDRGASALAERDLVAALVGGYSTALVNAAVRVERFVTRVVADDEDARARPVRHQTVVRGRGDEEIDFFISHASEDKDDVARPLAEALTERNFTVWFDEYELHVGDSLRRRIDDGLARSRYGVVVLSPHFFAKHWTQVELDGLAAQEVHSGTKRILPVWHNVTKADVLGYSPTLADKVGVSTAVGIEATADEIARALADAAASPPRARAPLVHSFGASSSKRDRLQQSYSALFRAALAAQDAIDQFAHRREGDSDDAHSKRWEERLAPIKQDADRALVNLRLETGTDPAVTAFIGVWNEFEIYRVDYINNRKNPGSVAATEMSRHRAEIQAGVAKLEELARAHLAQFDNDRLPIQLEVAHGFVGSEPFIFVTVYNDSDRPQRVDTVTLRMSNGAGDLVRARQDPFTPLPQFITETQNYQTGFPLAQVREQVLAKRQETGRPDIRVVAARVKLASGREVVIDARHVSELDF